MVDRLKYCFRIFRNLDYEGYIYRKVRKKYYMNLRVDVI